MGLGALAQAVEDVASVPRTERRAKVALATKDDAAQRSLGPVVVEADVRIGDSEEDAQAVPECEFQPMVITGFNPGDRLFQAS